MNLVGRFDEVFARDFFEWQKALTLAAELYECGFQAGFNTGDAGAVDIALFLLVSIVFDVEIKQFLTINKRDAEFFRLGRINQHAFHCVHVPKRTTSHS